MWGDSLKNGHLKYNLHQLNVEVNSSETHEFNGYLTLDKIVLVPHFWPYYSPKIVVALSYQKMGFVP